MSDGTIGGISRPSETFWRSQDWQQKPEIPDRVAEPEKFAEYVAKRLTEPQRPRSRPLSTSMMDSFVDVVKSAYFPALQRHLLTSSVLFEKLKEIVESSSRFSVPVHTNVGDVLKLQGVPVKVDARVPRDQLWIVGTDGQETKIDISRE